MVAAPVAAWLVRHIPPRLLGSAVGGLFVLTNTRTLLRGDWLAVSDLNQWLVYGVVWAGWLFAVGYSVRAHLGDEALRDRGRESVTAAALSAERTDGEDEQANTRI